MGTALGDRDADYQTRLNEVFPDLISKFDMYSKGRHFSATRSDRLGSMPKGAKVGDKICVFYGGSLPYVIRPCGEGRYTLIGDCYVNGLMYGEAMDMEDVKTETITLV